VSLAKEAVATGAPIIRPLWWIAPTDDTALTTATQFLLGNDLLVAPVLVRGARRRDIYLPAGTWRDVRDKTTLQGPTWLREYEVPLHELPLFERVV
jgi:alpha-glucosidase